MAIFFIQLQTRQSYITSEAKCLYLETLLCYCSSTTSVHKSRISSVNPYFIWLNISVSILYMWGVNDSSNLGILSIQPRVYPLHTFSSQTRTNSSHLPHLGQASVPPGVSPSAESQVPQKPTLVRHHLTLAMRSSERYYLYDFCWLSVGLREVCGSVTTKLSEEVDIEMSS